MINQKILKEEFNIRFSVAGYEFDLRKNIWNLKRGVIINLSYVYDFLDKTYHEGFIHTLSYFAQIQEPESVRTMFDKIKTILRVYNIKTFSEHELICAYSDLQMADYRGFIVLKSFLIKWKELGYYGIEDNAYEYLKVITIPTNSLGDVVKRRDPNLGPFNDQEIKMIVDGLETGIKQGVINDHCYIFTRLLLLSGRRPIQIMSLKHRDVIKNERGCFLRIPRAKQKNNIFRGAFREIEITEDILKYLMKVITHNINKVKEIISEDLNEKFFDDLPIFLSITQLCKVADEIDFSEYLKCDFLHINTGQARFWLKDFAKKFKMYSPRTGELLKIHPVRFRYTFGTLLARSGGSLSTIAFAMDHSSDTSAGYYIKNLSDNVNVIDKAVERYLKDISDVFLGKREYQGDLLQKALTMDIKKEHKNDRSCDRCQHFKTWNKGGE